MAMPHGFAPVAQRVGSRTAHPDQALPALRLSAEHRRASGRHCVTGLGSLRSTPAQHLRHHDAAGLRPPFRESRCACPQAAHYETGGQWRTLGYVRVSPTPNPASGPAGLYGARWRPVCCAERSPPVAPWHVSGLGPACVEVARGAASCMGDCPGGVVRAMVHRENAGR